MATSSSLETYLAAVEPAAKPLVVGLDRAIRKAHSPFDVAIKYRLLMYALANDWRTWVCAVDARKSRVSVKFLYGVLLDDPRHVLRAGTSVLMSWDFGPDRAVDAAGVTAYVKEAVSRYAYYKKNSSEVLAMSRKARSAGMPKRAVSEGRARPHR
jgi:hypothetical protein